jgi:hypothetical protein
MKANPPSQERRTVELRSRGRAMAMSQEATFANKNAMINDGSSPGIRPADNMAVATVPPQKRKIPTMRYCR